MVAMSPSPASPDPFPPPLQALEGGAIPVTLSRSAIQPYNYWEAVFGVPSEEIPFVANPTWEQNVDEVLYLVADPPLYERRRMQVRRGGTIIGARGMGCED